MIKCLAIMHDLGKKLMWGNFGYVITLLMFKNQKCKQKFVSLSNISLLKKSPKMNFFDKIKKINK